MKAFAAALALALPAASALAQDSVADFYRGKQVFLRIGSAPGSGYDIAGRLVGAHIGKHIPGNPQVIIQNVPGAGSLTLTNQLYNTAPRDGTVIGAITNGMPTAPILSPDTARFDLQKFGWIGSSAPETIMVMLWHTSPTKTIDDLYKRETVVGGVAHGTATVDNPLMANAFLGTKFKLVSGYEGTTHIDLAMERGEVEGHAGIGLVTAKARNQQWFAEKKVRIVAQFGFKPHPELADVPVFAMPKDEGDRQAVTVDVLAGDPAIGEREDGLRPALFDAEDRAVECFVHTVTGRSARNARMLMPVPDVSTHSCEDSQGRGGFGVQRLAV